MAPSSSGIPGDPAAIRAGAVSIGLAATQIDTAETSMTSSERTALGSWTGAASGAFAHAVHGTEGRADYLKAVSGAVEPLNTYATALEAAQQQYAAAEAAYHAAATTPRPADQLESPEMGAQTILMQQARERALVANQVAATAVRRIADAIKSAPDGQGVLASTTSTGLTNGLGLVGGVVDGLAGTRGLPTPPPVLQGAARAGGVAVPGLGIGLAGYSQYAQDEDNPDLSTGSRVGRAVAQGVTVGGAGALTGLGAGALTGAALGSAVPIVGTVAGALVGGVLGYFASKGVDAYNDDIVDWAGDVGDDVQDTIEDTGNRNPDYAGVVSW